MLMLKSPSLAINSHDVPGPNYRMWETVDAPPGMNATDVVHEIIRVNRLALDTLTPRKSGESACQAPLRRFCLIDDPRWLPGQRIAPRPD
jgi:hypothetical protein